jgi:hypothetical protein
VNQPAGKELFLSACRAGHLISRVINKRMHALSIIAVHFE